MSGNEKDRLGEDAADAEVGAAKDNEGCSAEVDPTAYDLIKDMWVDDHEVQIYQEVMKREKKPGGHPDLEDINAMEEPLYRLIGAVKSTDSGFGSAKNVLPATDPSVRGGQNRGSSNASSTPTGRSGSQSNDTGSSGANGSSRGQKKCSFTGSRIKRAC